MLIPVVLSASVLSGCAPFLPMRTFGNLADRNDPSKKGGLATQALCDVDRVRARTELLKRIDIDKFREVAQKVSREVTQEEITDLRRLEVSRRSGTDGSSEIGRRRSELIGEIYTGAIIRAGYKPSATETIPGTDLSYTVGVDSSSSGTDMYAGLLVGHLSKEAGQEGKIAQISLATNPDQSRYYVELYEFSRYETQADGSHLPVYSTLSLYDYVDQAAPHYCEQVESALDQQEFNTISGVDGGAVVTQPAGPPPPAPVPVVSAPAPAPERPPVVAPVPMPLPPAVPVPAPAPVPAPIAAPAPGPAPAPVTLPPHSVEWSE